ncbi:hypothetical protein [Brachybacterium sp. ACRRE]|uniref:hypothetical protein n=1 Tax=Brachybacterium sp. ACRRE TaxID=2918184 RepID=UPI001EF33ED6|nr:hypothetical protein [Brachybacterium sp. ACRRE]MCG7310431.1 hypothetical protein [Brachybacterium sp. ACRRE]
MKAETWIPMLGLFLTDAVVLWVIFSVARGEGLFSGHPITWVTALALSAILTSLLARGIGRRRRRGK